MAVGFSGALGTICLVLVLFRPPADPIWIALLIVLAAGALWLARGLARATRTQIILTRAGLHDGDGRVIAPMDNILGVERGAFAFKPSNGFLIVLSAPASSAWQPGLWWRVGRRVGVGGVTPSAGGRFMADALAALLVERTRQG